MSKLLPQFMSNNWQVDNAVGDGSTVIYSLSRSIAVISSLEVYVNGLLVSGYSFSNGNITFTTAPVIGQNIRVRYLKRG